MSSQLAEKIEETIAAGLDWQTLIDAAQEHGVLALVCRQLLGNFASRIPEQYCTSLRTFRDAVAQKNLFLAAEMLRLSARFRAENLIAIPYKGPLLAAQAYGDFGLRQFGDLDFAIQQKDLPRATVLLTSEGYAAVFGTISADEGIHPTHSEYQFRRSAANVIVEMQTETTLRYFPKPLNLEELQSRATRVAFAGGETLSFSAEDTLILLAVHGAKHFWERLLWIVDIAELSQAAPGIDWPKTFSLAEQMGVSRTVNLALYLAEYLLDAPLPRDVSEKIKHDRVAQKLGRDICKQFSMSAVAQMPVFARFRFRVASRDSFWAGMRFAMRIATSPTEPDRAAVPLPDQMSGVRRWLRPVLLMKRYGIRRSKSNERAK
jgi:hypothetical protein